MFGTILGSMMWIFMFVLCWLGGFGVSDGNGWIGLAVAVGAVGFTVLAYKSILKSILNDMEEKRKVMDAARKKEWIQKNYDAEEGEIFE